MTIQAILDALDAAKYVPYSQVLSTLGVEPRYWRGVLDFYFRTL